MVLFSDMEIILAHIRKEQTSGGKSTKVHVAGQNKRPGRACTTRFQLYRTQQEQFEGQLEKHTTIKHV